MVSQHQEVNGSAQKRQVSSWFSLIEQMGAQLGSEDRQADQSDEFVAGNHELLRENGFLDALVPAEFGGGGVSFDEMSDILRIIAHYSSSTDLALSMHQHLVAANVFKHKKGEDVNKFMKMVAGNKAVLISTGARDWLESNGTMTRTEGGYLFSATKQFASQSAGGGIAVTSAPYQAADASWNVLHFPVPLAQAGVNLIENWQAMGMRGTGSHAIRFENVFVPDSAIALSRPVARITASGMWS